jgi:hypothetical protein
VLRHPQKQAKVFDLATYQAAIGRYVVRKAANSPYFGRTAAAKVMYLAQVHVSLKLDLHPLHEAAGPLDKWIYDFEQQAQSKGWFEVHEKMLATGKKKMEYRCLLALVAPATEAKSLMSAGQQTEFDRLIHALADKKNRRGGDYRHAFRCLERLPDRWRASDRCVNYHRNAGELAHPQIAVHADRTQSMACVVTQRKIHAAGTLAQNDAAVQIPVLDNGSMVKTRSKTSR